MMYKTLTEYNARVHLEEVLTFGMALFLNSLIIIFSDIIVVPIIFTINVCIMVLIVVTAYVQRYTNSPLFKIYRDWYILVFLVTIFMEHNTLVPIINPNDVDNFLIRVDYVLFFQHHPTILLEKLLHPVVTELLQIVYASFYFLPFTLCLLLYLEERKIEYHIVASTILLGFYLSYIGYYIFPAIGPRFTLSHLQTKPLEGVLLFPYIHHGLAYLEGVTRDCFPSGHTLVSILTILLAKSYYKNFAPIATVWASLLILSTVYLRYHYVIDVIAGLLLGIATFRYGPLLARLYIFGKAESPFPVLDYLRNWWNVISDLRKR
ncbi:MAG: phosphatase PAP2 family protein [Spirochaetes bacterium]|nr:phosphatase PAP2 family protein [Spirochaetota bacterium]